MKTSQKKLKAIDLYSGIGGWSIGLKLNGIDVDKSFEWWEPAVNTSNANLAKEDIPIDIRNYDFKKITQKIDIVVGSPPCTQFSYSNRGGSGDIDDGIIDLYKFFECVSILKPRYWAMENVPRVKGVLENEINKGGQLYKFRKIIKEGFVEVIDFSEFGLPQKRKRCIASNADLDLLNAYKEKLSKKSLGDVLKGLSGNTLVDVNYDISLEKSSVTDNEKEEVLNNIEERMNREMKTNHPVYNNMSFPEKLSSPARTITATCTRVSRESLVVKRRNGFGRLSVRERGVIQGFPINYQFLGNSYSQKVKMIGNAIPPVFTYALASAFLGISAQKFKPLETKKFASKSKQTSLKTKTDTAGNKFRPDRGFRFAMPSLRFKSGTSFELSNKNQSFKCRFFYGDSKNIKELQLDGETYHFFSKRISSKSLKIIENKTKILNKITSHKLQQVWIGNEQGLSPFDMVDIADEVAVKIYDDLIDADVAELIDEMGNFFQINLSQKLKDNIYRIYSGLIVCSYINHHFLYKN